MQNDKVISDTLIFPDETTARCFIPELVYEFMSKHIKPTYKFIRKFYKEKYGKNIRDVDLVYSYRLVYDLDIYKKEIKFTIFHKSNEPRWNLDGTKNLNNDIVYSKVEYYF